MEQKVWISKLDITALMTEKLEKTATQFRKVKDVNIVCLPLIYTDQ